MKYILSLKQLISQEDALDAGRQKKFPRKLALPGTETFDRAVQVIKYEPKPDTNNDSEKINLIDSIWCLSTCKMQTKNRPIKCYEKGVWWKRKYRR